MMLYKRVVVWLFVSKLVIAFSPIKAIYNKYDIKYNIINYIHGTEAMGYDEIPCDGNIDEQYNYPIYKNETDRLNDLAELEKEEEIKKILGKYNKLWYDYHDEYYSNKSFMKRYNKRLKLWKKFDKKIDQEYEYYE
jgi:hypothetical protein